MNSRYYGVKIDVNSKQEYLFSSNRLKDVVGASKIIEFVTEILGRIIIEEMKKDYSNSTLNQEKFSEIIDDKKKNGEIKKFRGNVHIEGGGNSIYIFEEEGEAKDFTQRLSLYVLEHFEGLEINIVTEKFDFDCDLGIELYERLEKSISKKKSGRINPLRIFSFGMYDKCGSTGSPQGYEVQERSDEENGDFISKFVSKESYHKRRFYDEVIMDRFESRKFNEETDEDFYRIKPYMEDESPIKRKIIWMRSYYTSHKKQSVSNILGDYFSENTLLSKEDINNISNLNLGTRLENIENITKNNTESSYLGLTQLDGNGIGTALRGLSEYFIDEVSKNLEKVKHESNTNSNYLKKISNRKSPKKDERNITDNAKKIINEHNIFFFKFQETLSQELQKIFETAFIQVAIKIAISNNGKSNTAIVPIVMAGDDISFWVSGHDAIPVSVDYIKQIAKFKDNSSLKENIVREIKKDSKILGKFHNSELGLYKKGMKIFENMSVSGGTSITSISYPISQAAKIANRLGKNSKEKGIKFLNEETEIFPAIYDWEIVRGEFKEFRERKELDENNFYKLGGRPYIIVNKNCPISEEPYKVFEGYVNEMYRLSMEEKNNEQDMNEISKTSYIKRFRMAMDDENQAKLEAYKLGIGYKVDEKDYTLALYDAIELIGLKCCFENRDN